MIENARVGGRKSQLLRCSNKQCKTSLLMMLQRQSKLLHNQSEGIACLRCDART